MNKGNYKFHHTVWKRISYEAKDLISNLLSLDQLERLTAGMALNHPFCTGTKITNNESAKLSGYETDTSTFTNLFDDDYPPNFDQHSHEWTIPSVLRTPAAYAHLDPNAVIARTEDLSSESNLIQSGLLSPSTLKMIQDKLGENTAVTNDSFPMNSASIETSSDGKNLMRYFSRNTPMKLCIEKSNLYMRRKARLSKAVSG